VRRDSLRCACLTSALFFATAALNVAFSAGPALGSAKILYAYAAGRSPSPADCPRTANIAGECTLGQALARASANDVVALATPGSKGRYIGNWVVRTSKTTAQASISVKPAPGVASPVLDGNNGQAPGCGTESCDGPVLTISAPLHLDIEGVTIEDANNTSDGLGGAIQNIHGGTVTVSHSIFFHNYANANGGAIDNAGTSGTGTLAVASSSFQSNYAVNGDGGAIANADVNGEGTVVVSGSTFSANSAINGNGGAIDNGDTRGRGNLTLLASAFSGNVAGRAGAVDNADNGEGILVVSGCTFSDNVAALDDGGAIDNADWSGNGTLRVSGSTFSSNKTIGDGGAIDNADNDGSIGHVVISTSTFWGNIADAHGGAIDSSDAGSAGTLVVWASTFSRNNANNIYGAPSASGGGALNLGAHGALWVAADVFDGPCRSAGGTWYDEGYNVGLNGTCLRGRTGDVSHGAKQLGPLADHGGPTQTTAPLAGSPAIAAIPYMTSVVLGTQTIRLCPAFDQRGARNSSKHRCDAGALQSSS
jgi:hypothetical protein